MAKNVKTARIIINFRVLRNASAARACIGAKSAFCGSIAQFFLRVFFFMLDNVRIVLVNTSDQRNIGSAARAMKTMGITDLVLVAPEEQPEGKAHALSAGASDVLANARQVATLQEAIADCGLVLATSARSRTLDWPMVTPREAGQKVVHEGRAAKVALVFGREASG